MVASQYIFISSANRLFPSDTSSDFTVNLTDLDPDDDNYNITVQNLSIPASWQGINSYNNQIALSTTGASGIMTLTPGNYNANQILTEIATQSLIAGVGITGSYNSITDQFTFNSIGATGFQITAGSNQPFLGLSAGTHIGVSSHIYSDQAINLSGPREIRILSNLPTYSTNTWDQNNTCLLSIYPNLLQEQ